SLRSTAIQKAIEGTRAQATSGGEPRFTIVVNFPQSLSPMLPRRGLDQFARFTREIGYAADIRLIEAAGFVALDGASSKSEAELLGYIQRFLQERTQTSEFDPDVWPPIIIRDPNETPAKLSAAAGDKYSYREMDDFTDEIEKTIKTIPIVSKFARSGI